MEGKLVRDGIPKKILGNGEQPIVKVVSGAELLDYLMIKLVEEANEVCAAERREDIIAELADVGEVIAAICAATGISEADIREAQKEKLLKVGGFESGTILLDTK